MSGPYFDLYALCPERSVVAARRFLDEWAPARKLAAQELVFPQYDDDGAVLELDELLARLEQQPSQEYLIYWASCRDDAVEHLILGFTRDGRMIAGLSLGGGWEQPRERVADVLKSLATSVHANHAYLAAEEPPVMTQPEFVAECQHRELVWLDGIIDRRSKRR